MTKTQIQKIQNIAFLKAGWHADIVNQAYTGFLAEQHSIGADWQTEVFQVPGAFELPLLAKTLAQSGQYAAVVAAALVVDGGIYRHDFVAQAVVNGLMQVGLDTGIPVLSVSLTPHHFQPTADHHAFFHAHFVTKGQEAAQAVAQILRLKDTAVKRAA